MIKSADVCESTMFGALSDVIAQARVILAGALVLSLLLPASSLAEEEKPKVFPLEPANTSSPRAALKTFIDNINATYRIYRTEGMNLKTLPRMRHLGRRTLRTLDLSQVAPTQVTSVGFQAAAAIKEVLDRIELPPEKEIPDAEAMRALAEAGEPLRWRIPHTAITIARMEKGARHGEYLFTAGTVARADEFYQHVKHLPYKEGASAGLYVVVLHAPGWMIPERWIFALPAWMQADLLQLAIWQWLGMALVLTLGAVLGWLVQRWMRSVRQRAARAWHWTKLVTPVSMMVISVSLLRFIDDQIGVTGVVLTIVT
ncbi:MAG: hypothetical protein ACE5LB_13370, partial [Acidiferrobacterales bacterium]